MPKFISHRLREHLIIRYIGQEIWNGIERKATRLILMKEALVTFQREQIIRFGGSYNMLKNWCTENGYASPEEYYKECIELRGFDRVLDYRDWLAKKKGNKDFKDYKRKRIVDRGFGTQKEYLDSLAQKRGFINNKEYKKNWRQENKEKIKIANKRWRDKNARRR